MIIGLDILLERIKKGELIKNLSDRELNSPEGAGFDLRAGELYEICSAGFLGIDERETSKVKLLGVYEKGIITRIKMFPAKSYLVKIMEEISLDDDMIGIFHPRSSLFRSGVVFQSGVHAPGYKGCPSFGLYIAGSYPFEMELGARIAHINILRIEGRSSTYRGQWQGGRVSTSGVEQQI